MASSSYSSLTLSNNFLASLIIPPSASPKSPASVVVFPRKSPVTFATISTSHESPIWSNAMWFKSGYNVQVISDDNEPEEKLLMRFRREVFRAGILPEIRRRRFFENPRDKNKRKTKEAARKYRKRPSRPSKDTLVKKQETLPKKKDNEEDDNWDDYNVDLPY